MKKTLLLLLSFVAVIGMNAKVVELDFTNAVEDWGMTGNKATEAATYTHEGISATFAATTAYYFNTSSKYVMLGKKNSTMTLSGFDFEVAVIEVVGRAGASSAVKMNIFVGEDAVSQETEGATGSNLYLIKADSRTKGTAYTLKVTSDHNTQITAVKVYDAEDAPEIDEVKPYEPVGAGTLEDAYTTDDVIGFFAGKNVPTEPVWVKGNIGGCIDSKNGNTPFQPSSPELAVVSNIYLMADADDYVPVQLTSGTDAAAALNLKGHPEQMNLTVWVYGTLERYFSKPGVKNVTNWSLNGTTESVRTVTATTAQGRTFDLQGRQVKATRGLYIQNGEKVIR